MATGYTLIHEHHDEMVKSCNWIPQAIGGSFYGGDIKMLTTCFMIIEEEYDIEKTREYIIKGANQFLKEINSNENAITHLNHYPFTYEDLDYSLIICSKNRTLLGHTFLLKGDVMFSKADEFKHLQRIHEESYSEALEKVQTSLLQTAPKVVSTK